MTFGTLLRQYRERAGLSQEALAEKARLSVNAIGALERGERRRPYPHTIRALSDALGLPAAELDLLLNVGSESQAQSAPVAATPAISMASPQPGSHPLQMPTHFTPLVGRAAETKAAIHLLTREDVRLLTLTGPGGIGKTRLAIEVATHCHNAFADGVFFISLVSLDNAANVLPTIAQTLALKESSALSFLEGVIDWLQQKEVLLILDNLEHLTAAALDLLQLLHACPKLKLLVTSREALSIRGEHEVPVPALGVPRISPSLRFDDLQRYPSVQLFVERAQAAQASFVLDASNGIHIAQVCVWLDGLPLAIELAASWVRLLSCAEIATEIERNLDFLAAQQRDLPERHRSLRAVFDHSWELLSSQEQAVLRQLSLFRGGFTREMARIVAKAGLPILSSLMAKSLLIRIHQDRYDLHHVVRQYALEKLQAALLNGHRHNRKFWNIVSSWQRKMRR